MQTIIVEVVIGDKRLVVGRYDDVAVADAVARSWANWSETVAAILTPAGSPPVVFARFPFAPRPVA